MSQIATAGPELQVAKTIFVAEIDPSLNFSLVEYVDGRLDICRNGLPISPCPWQAHEVAGCVNTFQKIARIAAAAAGQEEARRQ